GDGLPSAGFASGPRGDAGHRGRSGRRGRVRDCAARGSAGREGGWEDRQRTHGIRSAHRLVRRVSAEPRSGSGRDSHAARPFGRLRRGPDHGQNPRSVSGGTALTPAAGVGQTSRSARPPRTLRPTWTSAAGLESCSTRLARLWLALALAVPLCATSPAVKVRVETARGAAVLDLPMERYVAGVLAGESSVFRSDAALRAMAVAARTYAVRLRGRHAAEGYDFCATTHCQRVDMEGITLRLASIAEETAGELVWLEGKPAFTPYTRDCGGRVEDAAVVWPDLAAPYLKSHPDAYCPRAGTEAWQWDGDPAKIVKALLGSGRRAPHTLAVITIVTRSASGRALTLSLTGAAESVRISAGSFRFAAGRELGWNTVRSDLYEIQSGGGRVLFQGRGAGHGVGLCQRGAEQMGAEGRSYRDVLAFYYPGTAVGITARGLAWQRLGGERVALWTTQ